MSRVCSHCTTALADDAIFCRACGRSVAAAAPMPLQPASVPANSGCIRNLVIFGCGCLGLALVIIALVAALGFFLLRNQIRMAIERVNEVAVEAPMLESEELVGTWIPETGAPDPAAGDILEFHAEGGWLIGASPEIGSENRFMLVPSPLGGWIGYVQVDGATSPVMASSPVIASLSPDKTRLTITFDPETAESRSVTFIRADTMPDAPSLPEGGSRATTAPAAVEIVFAPAARPLASNRNRVN